MPTAKLRIQQCFVLPDVPDAIFSSQLLQLQMLLLILSSMETEYSVIDYRHVARHCAVYTMRNCSMPFCAIPVIIHWDSKMPRVHQLLVDGASMHR